MRKSLHLIGLLYERWDGTFLGLEPKKRVRIYFEKNMKEEVFA
jgi:hypothetical protein